MHWFHFHEIFTDVYEKKKQMRQWFHEIFVENSNRSTQ